MGIVFGDSFGWAPNGTVDKDDGYHTGIWSSIDQDYAITDIGDGRKWCKPASGLTGNHEFELYNGSESTIVFHMLVDHEDAAFETSTVLALFYDGASQLGRFTLITGGYLRYQRGTTEVLTSTVALTPNQTNHVAVKVYFHDSAGTVDFWVNGVAAGSDTSLDTIAAGTSCDRIRVLNETQYCDVKVTDVVVDDAAFLGEVRTGYDECNAAGQDADWTPSAGSNHENVDEIPSDEESTYNRTNTVTDRDCFKHSGLAATISTVFAVIGLARIRKEGTGSSEVKVGVYHGASESQSSGFAMTQTYRWYVHPTTVNPSTASQWQNSELATAEVSVEKAA